MSAALESAVGVSSAMGQTLQNAKILARRDVCSMREDGRTRVLHNANMAKTADEREPNHLKAWREFRHMTQEELAAKVGTTGAVISLLESGSRKLSPKWLRALAPALDTRPGYLLDHDPNDVPTDVMEIWGDISDEDKPAAIRALQGFRRTGTTG